MDTITLLRTSAGASRRFSLLCFRLFGVWQVHSQLRPRFRAARKRKGYVLIMLALCTLIIFGMLALSVDLARLYIAKQEAQAFVDGAAIAAALKLDGTADGLERARTAAAKDVNRWNFGKTPFATPSVEFASSPTGSYSVNPLNPAAMMVVRVTAEANQVNFFAQVIQGSSNSVARAQSAAAQVPKTRFSEGSFPFSPMVHNASDADFGFTRGQEYTIRWAASPKLNKGNVCSGDASDLWVSQAEAGGGSERGYIEEHSAAVIRKAVEGDYQTRPLAIGDTVDMTGGAKQTVLSALKNRIAQDTDTTAANYASYTGNGRRLVVVPVNTWHPNYTVVGFAAFLLLTADDYLKGGNEPWCAVYLGPWVQGANNHGAGDAGAYVVRLVQ